MRSVLRHDQTAGHLGHVELDLLPPGIAVTTLPTGCRVNKQLRMVQFDGEHRRQFGPIVTGEAKAQAVVETQLGWRRVAPAE